MATLREIHRRIKAVKSTQQITKAMKMVAASKFRKAQQNMMDLRPYADKLHGVIKSLAGSAMEGHPLLEERPRVRAEVLVITSDKGLCGAFNTNVMREAMRGRQCLSDADCEGSPGKLDVTLNTVGKKALDYLKRRKVEVRTSKTGLSGTALSFEAVKEIAGDIVERYIAGEVDEVHLVYNEFVNVVKQNVRSVRILPTEVEEESPDELSGDFIFEPDKEQLLDDLLPKNVEIQIYRAMLESSASEEAARMTAMENATKAASDMIDALTLDYNKARQASITGELMDIVGGVEALKG